MAEQKRDKNQLTRISRHISKVLRHQPEAAGITLDEHGWANVNDLIEGVSKRFPIDLETLREIVEADEKGRYSFSADGKRIRANQGHSIPVDVELPEAEPPDVLYHGTARRFVDSILEQGLVPRTRLYVHLSGDYETAVNVGERHGNPVVLQVDAARMAADGHTFYRSVNGVWLAKAVPPEYLAILP